MGNATIKYNGAEAEAIFAINASINVPEEQTALAIAKRYGRERAFQEALAGRRKSSGYRQSGAGLTEILENVCVSRNKHPPRARIFDKEYLLITEISCKDVDGNEFERYGELYVKRDIERGATGEPLRLTPYQTNLYLQERKLFLPGFALTWNIIAALYQYRDDAEINSVLLHYKDQLHAQNTLVDWSREAIVHYPRQNDFTEHREMATINQEGKRVLLPFTRTEKRGIRGNRSLSDQKLEEGLQDPLMRTFLQQLTGLQDLSVLLELQDYFGKKSVVWTSSSNEARAIWFGGNSINLIFDTNNNFLRNSFRGVQLIKTRPEI